MRVWIIIGIALVAMVILGQSWLTPPLKAPPPIQRDMIDRLNLSGQAYAGAAAFKSKCAECHGALAQGGDAPGLLNRNYARDFRDAPLFHNDARQQIPEHRAFLGDREGMTFNEVELMARFLRELRDGLGALSDN